MPDISARLRRVRQRIRTACEASGREPGTVELVAVSKGVPATALARAIEAGQSAFGESYLQEALPKIAALSAQQPVWHFIGPVQSNKTRDLAEHFDWVQGIDRLKIAQRLSDQRPDKLPPLQVCVQVNISGEASKSGCAPEDAAALCAAVAALPHLQLRGLMALPAPIQDGANARVPFAALQGLFEQIRQSLPPETAVRFDTISAGMSDDLEAAVAEGSTLVRVGTAVFGERLAARTP